MRCWHNYLLRFDSFVKTFVTGSSYRGSFMKLANVFSSILSSFSCALVLQDIVTLINSLMEYSYQCQPSCTVCTSVIFRSHEKETVRYPSRRRESVRVKNPKPNLDLLEGTACTTSASPVLIRHDVMVMMMRQQKRQY